MIKPIGQRVIVRLEKSQNMTSFGIILPESAQEKKHIGTVVSVGTGATTRDGRFVPCELKEGQRIIFGDYHGAFLEKEDDGNELWYVNEVDVMAILED